MVGHVSGGRPPRDARSAVIATTRHKPILMLNVYPRRRSLFEQASGRFFDA
jgi:hypothetical protein